MNYIKRLVIVVAIFLLLIFLLSLFLPSSLQLEKMIFVDAKSELIYSQASSKEKMLNWMNKDEQELEQISVSGNGTNEIQLIAKNGEITEQIDLKEDKNGKIEVRWSVYLNFGINPVSKFKGLFVEEEVLKRLGGELGSLKKYIENLPQINSSKVSKLTLKEKQWFLSIRDTVNQAAMNNIHGKLYAEINSFMDENKITSNLAPIVIYHYWSDTLIDIEAGIQIKDSVDVSGNNIKLNYIPAGNIVSATHFGAYERLPETYFSINEWMRKNKVQVIGPPWEVYVTDPAIEPNPDKWETQINFPIQ